MLLKAAAGAAFAKLDASRKGSGVTLSNFDLTASISGLYMVAATNPVDISTSQGYYAEFAIDPATYSSDFVGFGICRSDTLTDTYLGAYANQACFWQDASHDESGVTITTPLMHYAGLAPTPVIKIAVANNKLWMGVVGRGWWKPSTNDFTGDPTTGTGFVGSGFAAGLYSLGMSSISAALATADFGASTFAETPPTGFIGFPG